MASDAEDERDTVARNSRIPGIGRGRQGIRKGFIAFIATALFATALFAALAQPVTAQRAITFNAPSGLTVVAGQSVAIDASDYASDPGFVISCADPTGVDDQKVWVTRASGTCDFTVRASVSAVAGNTTFSTVLSSSRTGSSTLTATFTVAITPMSVAAGRHLPFLVGGYPSEGAVTSCGQPPTGVDTTRYLVRRVHVSSCIYRIEVQSSATPGPASFSAVLTFSGGSRNVPYNFIITPASAIAFTAPAGGLSIPVGQSKNFSVASYATDGDHTISCRFAAASRHSLIASVANTGCDFTVRAGRTAGAATLSVIYNSSGGTEVTGVIPITVAATSSLTFTAPTALNVRVGQEIGINALLYASDGANAVACDVATGIVGGITVESPVGCSYKVTAGNTVGTASFVVPYASSSGSTLNGRININILPASPTIYFTAPTGLSVAPGGVITIDASAYVQSAYSVSCGTITQSHALIATIFEEGCSIQLTVGNTAGTATFEVPYTNAEGGALDGVISLRIGSIFALSIAGCTNGTFVDVTANPRVAGANNDLVEDCYALVAARNLWVSQAANHNLRSSYFIRTWGTGTPEQQKIDRWEGVTVTAGRVTELEIDNTGEEDGISGIIPTQLGNLRALTTLDLSSHQLSGTIPTQLGSLAALTSLDLSGNQLTGPIPAQFGALTGLTSLDLSSNDLIGTIPSQLGSLSSLTDLYLGGNRLIGFVPTAIGTITTLSTFSICDNQLTGDLPTALRTGVTLLGYPTAEGYTPIACQNPVEPQPRTPQPTNPQPETPQLITPTPTTTTAPPGGEDATGDVAGPRWNTLTVSSGGITVSEIRSTLGIPANYGIYTWNTRTQTWTRVTSSSPRLSAGTLVSFRTAAAPDPDLLEDLNLGSGSETVSLNRGWNLINVPSVVTLTEDSTFLIDDSLIDCDNLQGIVAVASYSASNRRWSLWLPCNPRTQARLTTGRNAPYLEFTEIAPGDTTYFYNNARQPIDIIWDAETQTYQVAN